MATALAAAGAAVLWACGPFFPNWLLGDEGRLTAGPTARFYEEIGRLFPPGDSRQPRAVIDRLVPDALTQTARIDQAELAEALRSQGLRADRMGALLAAYAETREEALRQAATRAGNPARLEPPAGLPAEFADYLAGAIAYRLGVAAEARAAWQRLLLLPAADRRHRSTWAAFMLGRQALRRAEPRSPAGDPRRPQEEAALDEAVGWFRKTRTLAADGFTDLLGLAAASLGWEARAEADRERFDRSLALYADQAGTDDPTAADSLRLTARAAIRAGHAALVAAAREPQARDALTSLILAQPHPLPPEHAPGDLPPPPDAVAWLAALRAAGIRDAPGADRLAWSAYRAGDWSAARGWLAVAHPDSPVARWVRARLLLRDGKLSEAEPLLAGLGALPKNLAIAGDTGDEPWVVVEPELATRARAQGEAGVVALARGDFTGALDQLLRGGYWLDAAYIAERVLTLEELKVYVDRNWRAELARGSSVTGSASAGERAGGGGETTPWHASWAAGSEQIAPPLPELAAEIRYLLARRLVREGRGQQALPYMPAPLQPRLAALNAAAAAGHEALRPAAERAVSLFKAACITRQEGLELRGTTVDPDWQALDGQLSADFIAEERDHRDANPHLRATAGELARARRQRAHPWKRFHYRYTGAELARAAAALLPDGSAEKAGMLATAGRWLAERDPAAAQHFYAALVRCCRTTALGRAAEAQHWLPKADTCSATFR